MGSDAAGPDLRSGSASVLTDVADMEADVLVSLTLPGGRMGVTGTFGRLNFCVSRGSSLKLVFSGSILCFAAASSCRVHTMRKHNLLSTATWGGTFDIVDPLSNSGTCDLSQPKAFAERLADRRIYAQSWCLTKANAHVNSSSFSGIDASFQSVEDLVYVCDADCESCRSELCQPAPMQWCSTHMGHI